MLKLVIANKVYSSWSMRPWMVLKHFAIPFEEIVIPLRLAESRERVLAHSPSGKVPALITPEQTIWESLAIIEYLAESHPEKAIWPRDRVQRALARAISNEMHGGFQALRQGCPMNIAARYQTPEIGDALARDIARVEQIWRETRERYGNGGPYLFGAFSAADAMYAPVASRFDTYQVPISTETRDYVDTILNDPSFVAWRADALKETWSIPDYASGHTLIESYR